MSVSKYLMRLLINRPLTKLIIQLSKYSADYRWLIFWQISGRFFSATRYISML